MISIYIFSIVYTSLVLVVYLRGLASLGGASVRSAEPRFARRSLGSLGGASVEPRFARRSRAAAHGGVVRVWFHQKEYIYMKSDFFGEGGTSGSSFRYPGKLFD